MWVCVYIYITIIYIFLVALCFHTETILLTKHTYIQHCLLLLELDCLQLQEATHIGNAQCVCYIMYNNRSKRQIHLPIYYQHAKINFYLLAQAPSAYVAQSS